LEAPPPRNVPAPAAMAPAFSGSAPSFLKTTIPRDHATEHHGGQARRETLHLGLTPRGPRGRLRDAPVVKQPYWQRKTKQQRQAFQHLTIPEATARMVKLRRCVYCGADDAGLRYSLCYEARYCDLTCSEKHWHCGEGCMGISGSGAKEAPH